MESRKQNIETQTLQSKITVTKTRNKLPLNKLQANWDFTPDKRQTWGSIMLKWICGDIQTNEGMCRGRASGETEEKIKNGALNGPVMLKMAVGTLVWLSPISVSHVYVCCKDEMATTEGPLWVDFVPRWHLGMWVPIGATGVEKVSVSPAGEVGGLSCWGGNSACLENLLGGTGVGEMSEGFSSWSMTTCHSLCAWCWMLRVLLSSP